jgi:radical SAM protein with 4Fe4S-binding SPASM domain
MADLPTFTKLIDQAAPYLHSLTLYFQGEPFLHPHITDMFRYSVSRGIFTATSTNAHFLNAETAARTVRSGLHKIIISIDGASEQTYKTYRVGGQLQKVIDGTAELIRQKREQKSNTPHVIWQFVAFRHNENEVTEIRRMASDIGVDEVTIKTAQVYDLEKDHEILPLNQKLSRYKKDSSGKYAIDNPLVNSCWRMWQGCVVTWDGKVVPCCFDKDATYQVGDLNQLSLSDIWHSEVYHDFRASLLRSRKDIAMCANCSEGSRVWGLG